MPQRPPEWVATEAPLAGMCLGIDLIKATPEVRRLALDLAKALNYPEEFLAPIRKVLGMEAKEQRDPTFLSEI